MVYDSELNRKIETIGPITFWTPFHFQLHFLSITKFQVIRSQEQE